MSDPGASAAASAASSASTADAGEEGGPGLVSRGYHRVELGGRIEFIVDVRYHNLQPIGRGAYGLVAAADDSVTGRRVAIKRISRLFVDLVDAKRILRELKLLRHLRGHENVVDIVDVMTSPPDSETFDVLYIVTQLFECDLDRIINSPQPLTDQHVQYFVYQILRGLKWLHSAGVLHRDMKSSNMLVNGNCDLAICDFGLARGIVGHDVKLTEYVVTRWYRAPELLCNCTEYGPAVDIWSVGCIMAEILIRRVVFSGRDPLEQLHLVVSFLGSPEPEELDGFRGGRAQAIFSRLPHYEKRPMEELITGASPVGLDLLGKMLLLDPRKRITVDEALEHPYFAELHRRADEPECGSTFDFSFEEGYEDGIIPREVLMKLMREEMILTRKDTAIRLKRAGYGEELATGIPGGMGGMAVGGGGGVGVGGGGEGEGETEGGGGEEAAASAASSSAAK